MYTWPHCYYKTQLSNTAELNYVQKCKNFAFPLTSASSTIHPGCEVRMSLILFTTNCKGKACN